MSLSGSRRLPASDRIRLAAESVAKFAAAVDNAKRKVVRLNPAVQPELARQAGSMRRVLSRASGNGKTRLLRGR
ncbi:hypothetical protein BN2476_680052 [Paraburkholderia piptadeniae]|uniref:Uncharacterized protein n=1 Tax=Paraburkholderia piptadeniae TaxID=1701573 RepID=A0A1N7SPI0_9BURK|nr:hypothetical protein BN2476_680052 [Paraburkholderia piptadeniae]